MLTGSPVYFILLAFLYNFVKTTTTLLHCLTFHPSTIFSSFPPSTCSIHTVFTSYISHLPSFVAILSLHIPYFTLLLTFHTLFAYTTRIKYHISLYCLPLYHISLYTDLSYFILLLSSHTVFAYTACIYTLFPLYNSYNYRISLYHLLPYCVLLHHALPYFTLLPCFHTLFLFITCFLTQFHSSTHYHTVFVPGTLCFNQVPPILTTYPLQYLSFLPSTQVPSFFSHVPSVPSFSGQVPWYLLYMARYLEYLPFVVRVPST